MVLFCSRTFSYGFVVGDSWCSLTDKWWFGRVYWMLETVYWIIQTLYWIRPPWSHPPNFYHWTTLENEQYWRLHTRKNNISEQDHNRPAPATLHTEQHLWHLIGEHLWQSTGEHHCTPKLNYNTQSHQLIFQHWTTHTTGTKTPSRTILEIELLFNLPLTQHATENNTRDRTPWATFLNTNRTQQQLHHFTSNHINDITTEIILPASFRRA